MEMAETRLWTKRSKKTSGNFSNALYIEACNETTYVINYARMLFQD